MCRNRRNYEYEPIGSANNIQDLHSDNKGEAICKIYGYTNSNLKTFLYHLLGLILLGIPYVTLEIFTKLKTLKYKKCSLEDATILLACDSHGKNTFIEVKTDIIQLRKLCETEIDIRYFIYQHTKFIWVHEKEIFATLDVLIPYATIDDYLEDTKGLDSKDYINVLQLYGPNKIEVEVKSYWKLFIEEVFNPFYMFQVFSVILWLFDDYISYSICVVILTLFSSITSLIQTRRQSEALHKLVESSKCHEAKVLRQNYLSENVLENIDPTGLVPGDLLVLPAGNFTMPCDAVLLTGQCIVNESVLTGESVPVTITSLHSSSELYDPNTQKRHTLFSGTSIIQTRYYGGEHVLARVVRTGFETTKGSLVKSILFPTPVGLKFYKDSFKFIFVLFTLAATGMGYSLYMYIERGATIQRMIIRTLDIITIVVPPALPAAMAVGTIYSQNRLKEKGIFCISPPRINVCGKIKLACFDKTGTLTHDGLDMNSVVPCNKAQFSDPVTEVSDLDARSQFVQAMATCHSLTRIEGNISGDPLDLKMFEFTNWDLQEPGEDEHARYDMLAPTVVMPRNNEVKNNGMKKPANELLKVLDNEVPYEIGILRQFPFSSTLQCMSVICRVLEVPNMVAFTKGAPEKLQGICLPHTLPSDFNIRLSQYTAQGYRVIAVAYKDLPKKFKWKEAQKTKRDVIECDLIFLGFLIMQNPLKEQTKAVIQVLHSAHIRMVMITGDNILTAMSVARDCGMVRIYDQVLILSFGNCDDPNEKPKLILENTGTASEVEDEIINFNLDHCHFAIDGRTWEKLKRFYPELIPSLLVRTVIFARFQPEQKTQLIIEMQNIDYVVSMVGDGANDCGALKAAHVGVSLSQAEASVAAPFTSSIEDISCLIHLMMEGRCALVTSFAIFKYMALYSLIQFITILILYRERSILGDYQFLFIDLIIIPSLAVCMGRQGPSGRLGTKRPMSSLVAAKNLIPLFLQVAFCALFQMGALLYLKQQNWFLPIPPKPHEEITLCWENTVLFTVSSFQYVILALVYCKGRPYREMVIRNHWFLLTVMSLTVVLTFIMIHPGKMVAELLELMFLPRWPIDQIMFRYKLLVFPITHFILAVFIEVGMADRGWLKKLIHCFKCKRFPKNQYKRILDKRDEQLWSSIDSSYISL